MTTALLVGVVIGVVMILIENGIWHWRLTRLVRRIDRLDGIVEAARANPPIDAADPPPIH